MNKIFSLILIISSLQLPLSAGYWDEISGAPDTNSASEPIESITLFAASFAFGAALAMFNWVRESIPARGIPHDALGADEAPAGGAGRETPAIPGPSTPASEEGAPATATAGQLHALETSNPSLISLRQNFFARPAAEELILRYDLTWPGFREQLYAAFIRFAESDRDIGSIDGLINLEYYEAGILSVTQFTTPQVRHFLNRAIQITLNEVPEVTATTGLYDSRSHVENSERIILGDLLAISGDAQNSERVLLGMELNNDDSLFPLLTLGTSFLFRGRARNQALQFGLEQPVVRESALGTLFRIVRWRESPSTPEAQGEIQLIADDDAQDAQTRLTAMIALARSGSMGSRLSNAQKAVAMAEKLNLPGTEQIATTYMQRAQEREASATR